MSETIGKGQKPPYILLTGSHGNTQQAFLVVDKTVVCECGIHVVQLMLLSSFFVFNVQYPAGCSNYFSFMEYVLLNTKTAKLPASVRHFLASIDSP